jgi:hypothetical protein
MAAQEVPRPPPKGLRHGRVRLDRRFQRYSLKVKGEHLLQPFHSGLETRGIYTTLRLQIGLVCGSRFSAESSNWLRCALRYTCGKPYDQWSVSGWSAPIAPSAGSFGVPYRNPTSATTARVKGPAVVTSLHPITRGSELRMHADINADSQEEGREPRRTPRMEL